MKGYMQSFSGVLLCNSECLERPHNEKFGAFNIGMLKNVRLLTEMETYCCKIGAMETIGAYYNAVWR